jgi:hypothetical protein
MEAGYARAEERNREAREALEPLAERGRPMVVTVAAVLVGVIAVSIIVGYLTGAKVEGSKPALGQILVPALLLGTMSWGMWRARYWAVLGFQMILVLLIFSAVFGLSAEAASVPQVIATLALLAVSGTFFWLMVKAMARIQMPTRRSD